MEKNVGELLDSCSGEIEFKDISIEFYSDSINLRNVIVKDLAFDSRAVVKGSLFFALPGTHTSGTRFVAQAIQNGASAVVLQDDFSLSEKQNLKEILKNTGRKVAFLRVPDSRFSMAPISAAFYDYPSRNLVIFGVTGTEGKSSTVSFIWQLLKKSEIKAGFISTVQYSLGDEAIANPEHQTTPEAPIIQKRLYEMLENGCIAAVLESSSHGLSVKTNRLGNVDFDCSVFMNVTLEHLEFHKTYEQYKSDKANLFRALDSSNHTKNIAGKTQTLHSFGIVNLEDPAAPYFASCTKSEVVGFATKDTAFKTEKMLLAKNIKAERYGISFNIEDFCVKAPLPGSFNAYNLMAALLAISGIFDIPYKNLIPLAETLEPVKGRMTVVDAGQTFEVIVDYAHTPSSFETIFPPIKKRCAGKIICVFGSGGERDTTKRPLQGEIASRFCDIVILADEDPRQEEPMEILNQIAVGCKKEGKIEGKNLFLIPDRKMAIRKALSFADASDIVLFLGKSHENSIIYKNFVMPYDEISEVQVALKELGEGQS